MLFVFLETESLSALNGEDDGADAISAIAAVLNRSLPLFINPACLVLGNER